MLRSARSEPTPRRHRTPPPAAIGRPFRMCEGGIGVMDLHRSTMRPTSSKRRARDDAAALNAAPDGRGMKLRHLCASALIALLGVASHAAFADDWKLTVSTDVMTDQERRMAVTTNREGHVLSLYRIASGQVWMNFAISEGSLDMISPDKLIDYRIDKHEAVRLSNYLKLRKLGVVTSEWEPKWVNFLIWHGKENEGRGKIAQLFAGDTFTVRYYLSTGGYKDTRFSLAGAAPTMADAIGISAQSDPAGEERAQRILAARKRHISKCPKDPRAPLRSAAERLATAALMRTTRRSSSDASTGWRAASRAGELAASNPGHRIGRARLNRPGAPFGQVPKCFGGHGLDDGRTDLGQRPGSHDTRVRTQVRRFARRYLSSHGGSQARRFAYEVRTASAAASTRSSPTRLSQFLRGVTAGGTRGTAPADCASRDGPARSNRASWVGAPPAVNSSPWKPCACACWTTWS